VEFLHPERQDGSFASRVATVNVASSSMLRSRDTRDTAEVALRFLIAPDDSSVVEVSSVFSDLKHWVLARSALEKTAALKEAMCS